MFSQMSDGTESSQQAKATTHGEADVDQDLLVAVKFFCENIDTCTRLYTRKVLLLHGLEGTTFNKERQMEVVLKIAALLGVWDDEEKIMIDVSELDQDAADDLINLFNMHAETLKQASIEDLAKASTLGAAIDAARSAFLEEKIGTLLLRAEPKALVTWPESGPTLAALRILYITKLVKPKLFAPDKAKKSAAATNLAGTVAVTTKQPKQPAGTVTIRTMNAVLRAFMAMMEPTVGRKEIDEKLRGKAAGIAAQVGALVAHKHETAHAARALPLPLLASASHSLVSSAASFALVRRACARQSSSRKGASSTTCSSPTRPGSLTTHGLACSPPTAST